MSANSKIQWTDHTFNPWWGCQRVSPGCVNCYAETWAKRTGHQVWGPSKTTPRREMSDAYWQKPLAWNRAAQESGERARVFCASMADVFEDHPQLPPLRERLWALIEETPWLDWQLLTKRPENIMAMVPERWQDGFPQNVWVGCSVENQELADTRIPVLLRVPAVVRFLSCEPLIGPIDFTQVPGFNRVGISLDGWWVIVGGESGPRARPSDVRWLRRIVQQCRAAGVPAFVKQLGAYVRDRNDAGFMAEWETYVDNGRPAWPSTVGVDHNPNVFREEYHGAPVRVRLDDAKGGDPSQWPDDLRVREFPTAAAVAS